MADDHIISWLDIHSKKAFLLTFFVGETAAINLFHSRLLLLEFFWMGLPRFEEKCIRRHNFWTRVALEVAPSVS